MSRAPSAGPQAGDPQALAANPFLSAFVTANAGSGKTKTLIDRVARLLLAGAEPDQILCVTYTRAAAAEMQDRLFKLLGDWSVLPDDALRTALGALEERPGESYARDALSSARALFARALETPGGLRIQTLHAFCEKLLRRFPLEAGVSPGFEVLDDLGGAEMARQAHMAIARHALTGQGRIADAYARLSVDLDHRTFLGLFGEFSRRSEDLAQFFRAAEAGEGVAPAIWRALTGAPNALDPVEARAALVDMSAGPDPDAWLRIAGILNAHPNASNTEKALSALLASSQGRPAYEDIRSTLLTKDWTVQTWFARSPRLRPQTWVVETLQAEGERLLDLEMRRRTAEAGQRTLDVLVLAQAYLEAYRIEKDQAGKLDFTDLVSRTLALTRTAPMAAWVLYKLDQRLAHVLVDEAQDTAPDQWGILRGLTGDYFAGAGRAASGNGPARSLFVVGDVKQSIYSFQGAAPGNLALEFAHHSQAAAAVSARFERIDLTRSWRSVQQVLDFVDAVFAGDDKVRALVGGQEDTPPAIRHEAGRTDAGCVDIWDLVPPAESDKRDAWQDPPDALGSDSSPRVLARRIVGEIRRIVNAGEAVGDKETREPRPATWGDILILVRRRGALFDEILRELKRSGVPVGGADRLKLSSHILFEDLRALVRFALYPRDDLTLAALLRSPFCDIDDQGLFDLAWNRPDASLWDTLRRRAGEADRAGWSSAVAFLEQVIASGAGRTPYAFIVSLLETAGPCGRSQRQRLLTRLGREAEEALGVFLEKTLELEQAGSRHIEGFAADLDRLDVDVAREMESAGADEVRIMTAHGSKGLEAPIVILPDMTFADSGRAGLVKSGDGTFLWLASKGEDCPVLAQARADRDRESLAELDRLLYVGLTRARDRLVLCGVLPGNRKEDGLKGWWSAVTEATEARLPEVRRIEREDFGFRRFGPDPAVLGASAARRPAPAPPAPGWLGRPARPEPLSRLASPSDLGDSAATVAVSPLASAGGLGRFRRGELIHRLLQILPDLEPDRWDRAARSLLQKESGLDETQVEEMTQAALGVLRHPDFAFLFGPGSRAEAAIIGGAPEFPEGLRISGRIDRLVVRPDEVLFADFKTNRPAPATIEAADPAYLRQLAMYRAVLGALYPGRRIRAALVWTDGPRLTPAPEPLLQAALQALREGS